MQPKKVTKAKAKVTNPRKKAQKEEAQDLPQQASPVDEPPKPADEGQNPPDQPVEPSGPDGSSKAEDEEDPSKQISLELTPEQEQELEMIVKRCKIT